MGLLCGCNAIPIEEERASDPLNSTRSAVIVGTVNWSSTNSLTEGYPIYNAGKVGYLDIPARATRCTAWLASTDIVITNNHCIADAAQAAGAQVAFNYNDGVSSASYVWYNCSTFLETWPEYDMTALRCGPRNGLTPGQAQGGWLHISTTDAVNNQELYVIHQNCDYYTDAWCSPTKKFSPGRVTHANLTQTDVAYDADTLGGSSGSPVFSSFHHVVALHHLGYGGNSQGRGSYNSGVKASFLRAALYEIGVGWECGNGTCDPNEANDGSCPYDCTALCQAKCSDGVTCCGADGSCPDGLSCW
ncbi:trypsin-like serine peptidase [Cystobacter ferrugineus]|nr:trypsin-like peptidase domain-containing protein [Cystobacter ferrugineus]